MLPVMKSDSRDYLVSRISPLVIIISFDYGSYLPLVPAGRVELSKNKNITVLAGCYVEPFGR